MKTLKCLKKVIIILLCISIIIGIYDLLVNAYIVSSTKNQIISYDEYESVEDSDCIIVLGCLVKPNGKPSDMLSDRLRCGVELYDKGAASKILMSGDHGTENYNEVQAMKNYATDRGIPSTDIFMDHAGFCTYDSIYRAKEIFGAKKIIIVTQRYHLYRALYIAESLGIDATGVACDYNTYSGQALREIREIIARNKDFIYTLFKPEPKHLGQYIPISTDGNITQD
ncbi:MAG: ElyC/SanA/YdcF family protein [Acutalibacteraceae bacterium]|nr:ElyC/SanA/YdcF family protein [Acutalibacteraceae bacterium]